MNYYKNIGIIILASLLLAYSISYTLAGFNRQIQYDSALIEYKESIDTMQLAQKNLLVAEKTLAKEKLEQALELEEYDEILRLNTKLQNITKILENKDGWEFVFQMELK